MLKVHIVICQQIYGVLIWSKKNGSQPIERMLHWNFCMSLSVSLANFCRDLNMNKM
jgi:hypothetical protein